MTDEYAGALEKTAGRIRSKVPADLVGKFAAASGITKDDFIACRPVPCGNVCAVDGSNVMLVESGSIAVTLYRAGMSGFRDNGRTQRSVTPFRVSLIGPEPENQDFPDLYGECFGEEPGKPLANEDREKAAGILRDTLEYWTLEQAALSLPSGALLLRDGPLRVSHASHDAVLGRIESACLLRDIAFTGVSKRTTATWGGGHPLLPAVHALAGSLGVPAPWGIRIDRKILDHEQFARWQHGDLYVARLHPQAKSPLKIDLVRGIPEERAPEILDRIAACSGDGRLPGYPYPLFDAHRTVVLNDEITGQVRSDLLRVIAETGLDRQTYEILFGDYHDEFARY